MRLGTVNDPVSFDPYQSVRANSSIARNCYAYLLGKTGTGDAVPHVAESWEATADHRAVTVHLRPGLTFHTGKDVLAEDLVVALERGADPERGLNFNGAMAIVESWEQLDDLSFRVAFVSPVADTAITDFLITLPVVDSGRNDLDTLTLEEAGCGPFQVAEFDPGVSLTLARFDNTFDSSLPQMDTLVFTLFDSEQTILNALQSGDIDAGLYVSPRSASALGDEFTVFDEVVDLNTVLLLLNPTRPPFDDKVVRHALQRCIDRERIRRDVFAGRGEPVVIPYPPDSAVSDPGLVTEYGFDLDAARTLLDQSGVGSPSAELILNGVNDANVQIAQIVQSDLAEIGFELAISAREAQAFQEPYLAGQFDAAIAGIGGNRSNPAAKTVSPFFRTSENPIWGEAVPSAYADAIARASSALTPEDAQTAADDIRAVHLDEAWAIGIQTEPELHAGRAGVHGLVPSSGAGTLDLREAWVEDV